MCIANLPPPQYYNKCSFLKKIVLATKILRDLDVHMVNIFQINMYLFMPKFEGVGFGCCIGLRCSCLISYLLEGGNWWQCVHRILSPARGGVCVCVCGVHEFFLLLSIRASPPVACLELAWSVGLAGPEAAWPSVPRTLPTNRGLHLPKKGVSWKVHFVSPISPTPSVITEAWGSTLT